MAWSLSGDGEQGLIELDRLTVFYQDAFDHTALFGLDLIHHFHGFNDADHVTLLDRLTDLNKVGGAGGWGTIKRPYHGGALNEATRSGLDRCQCRALARLCRYNGCCWGCHHLYRVWRGNDMCGRDGTMTANANRFFAFRDFQLIDAGFFQYFDEFLDLTNVHLLSHKLKVVGMSVRF